jgi:DNA-binding SARP family transcriptional activator/tetratricopeptide (TPR) repeat protein
MEFRILGPLEVSVERHSVFIRAPKQRTLLAALLLKAGEVVPVDELVDRLWDDSPPHRTAAALQVHVSRLRSILNAHAGPAGAPVVRIEAHPGGYLLDVPPESIDIYRFRQAVARAKALRRCGDHVAELRILVEALGEWRGAALSLVASESLQRYVVPALHDERLQVLERRFDLELDFGRHAEVLTEIRQWAEENPLRERFWGQLMQALHRCGRQAEAVDTFRRICDLLTEELGISPNDELRRINSEILRSSSDLSLPNTMNLVEPVGGEVGAPVREPWHIQCQLPASVADFVGRQEILARMRRLLSGGEGEASVPIVCLSGPPGIGKTALAVRVGHELRTSFHDGQWYVPMTDSRNLPRTPDDVLFDLLRASGVNVDNIPDERESRASFFRARLADRRVLIIFDDVHDATQIRDLLPGTRGCAVVVIARENLWELAAIHGARCLTLNTLTDEEAIAVLSGLLGKERIAAESAAVREMIALCGHLPLALRVAGGNLAFNHGCSIAEFNERLRMGGGVDLLVVDTGLRDATRAAFRLAYSALPPDCRRFFRMLAVVSGMTLTPETAAELAGVSRPEAEALLGQLAAVNLIEENVPGRYSLHSLIGLCSSERADAEATDRQLDEALRRIGEYYLFTADAAVSLCHPGMIRMPLPPPVRERTAPSFQDEWSALEWLECERANMVAVIVTSVERGLGDIGICLTDTLRGYFASERHYANWYLVSSAGLAAAELRRDRYAQAVMRLGVGLALNGSRQLERAGRNLTEALAEFQSLGVSDFEAETLKSLAVFQQHQPNMRIRKSAELLERSLALSRELRLPSLEASCLLHLGLVAHAEGRLAAAVDHLTEALKINGAHGGVRCRTEQLAKLGLVHNDLGDHREAEKCLREALRVSGEHSILYTMAMAQQGLAEVCHRQRRLGEARALAQCALRIAQRQRYQALEAHIRNLLGRIEWGVGEKEMAVEQFGRGLEVAKTIGHPAAMSQAHVGMAYIDVSAGRRHGARQHALRAVQVADEAGYRLQRSKASEALARITLGMAEPADPGNGLPAIGGR